MPTILERLTGFKNNFQTAKNSVAAAITGKGITASGNDTCSNYATKIRSLQIKNSNAPDFGLYNWKPSLTLHSKSTSGNVTLANLAVLSVTDVWNWKAIDVTASILWGNPAATPNTRTMTYNFRSTAMYPANANIIRLTDIIDGGGSLQLYNSPTSNNLTDITQAIGVSITLGRANNTISLASVSLYSPNTTYMELYTDSIQSLSILFAHPL